jgi:hypothetical protein
MTTQKEPSPTHVARLTPTTSVMVEIKGRPQPGEVDAHFGGRVCRRHHVSSGRD